jgi:4-diphosphocytidyl-2-C-methyl-D-erythritol kinase
VPFFVYGRNALVQGIGERLAPIAAPELRYAVIKPAASIATASIFGSPLLKRDTPSVILAGSLGSTALAGLSSGFGHNDLEPPAQAACAEVAQAARWLETRFGNSRMTGSGSAVFARVGPDVSIPATWTLDDAAAWPGGWVGRMCRGLPQHPLLEWAD